MNDLLTRLMNHGVPTAFKPGALRIRYQRTGLALIRRDFRIDKAIWFQFGQMARTQGISRCLLFVTLLRAYVGTVSEFRQRFNHRVSRLVETFLVNQYQRLTSLTYTTHGPPEP